MFGADLLDSDQPTSGIYEIHHICGEGPHLFHNHVPSLQAHCDNKGWILILRRIANISEQVNFRRSWREYQHGFGDLNTEFRYGLHNIHCVTTREQLDLRIELKYDNGTKHTDTYEHSCCRWIRE